MGTNTPLCNFAQSKALKELGYTYPKEGMAGYLENEDGTFEFTLNLIEFLNRLSIYEYVDDFVCPTLDQALRWFRNVKGLHGHVGRSYHSTWSYFIERIENGNDIDFKHDFQDHDVCQSALVSRIIEILNETKSNQVPNGQ